MKPKTRILIATLLIAFVLIFASEAVATDSGNSKSSESIFSQHKSPVELGDNGLGGSIYRMILSLVLVGALAVGAMYASKKLLPKVSGMTGKRVKVIETVSLGSRRAVHLLQVGNRQILIGSTQNTITPLAEMDSDAFKDIMSEQIKDKHEEGS